MNLFNLLYCHLDVDTYLCIMYDNDNIFQGPLYLLSDDLLDRFKMCYKFYILLENFDCSSYLLIKINDFLKVV